MNDYELRKYALDREHARAVRIASAVAGLPKRKGGELSLLVKLIDQAHKTLCAYDLQQTPPPIASMTETWFDGAIERVEQIKAEAAAPAEQPPADEPSIEV